MGRNTKFKEYKMQDIQPPAIQPSAIPGITVPQTDFNTAIGGPAKPENNATVGATAGSNLKDSSNSTLGDQDIKNIDDLVLGESVDVSSGPVPAFVNQSDNKAYICKANDAAKLSFVGFFVSGGSADDMAKVQFSNIASGFSGLSEGEIYYVQDDGTIGIDPGTYPVQVGVAVNQTKLAIISQISTEVSASDTVQESADTQRDTPGNGSSSWYKMKEITFKEVPGIVRLKAFTTAATNYSGRAEFYVNDIATGVVISPNVSGQEGTVDVPVKTGDKLQLYVEDCFYSGVYYATSVSYLKVCFTKNLKPFPSIINID